MRLCAPGWHAYLLTALRLSVLHALLAGSTQTCPSSPHGRAWQRPGPQGPRKCRAKHSTGCFLHCPLIYCARAAAPTALTVPCGCVCAHVCMYVGVGCLSLQSSSWDPLGAPVVGASGPIARAAGNVYHSSLAFRKEVQVRAHNHSRACARARARTHTHTLSLTHTHTHRGSRTTW
jgi:hypothetical protein